MPREIRTRFAAIHCVRLLWANIESEIIKFIFHATRGMLVSLVFSISVCAFVSLCVYPKYRIYIIIYLSLWPKISPSRFTCLSHFSLAQYIIRSVGIVHRTRRGSCIGSVHDTHETPVITGKMNKKKRKEKKDRYN